MSAREVTQAEVDAAVEAVSPIIPNHGGVVWEFTHEDGQVEPVTLAYAMRKGIEAAAAVRGDRDAKAEAWNEGARAMRDSHPSWWNTIQNPYYAARGGAQ